MNGHVMLIPLGGVGEMGLNMMALQWEDEVLIIDAGSMFPEEHMLGVDLVIPDISFLRERALSIRGIILTHGHEDHIGALPFIIPYLPGITIYGTPLTLALVREKLLEHRLRVLPPMREVSPREVLHLGPFHLEFIKVCHSIVDGVGLAIRTPEGIIVHTGDFKLDPSPWDDGSCDMHALSRYGEEGVLLLLSDSTNVEKAGYSPSEREIYRNLEEIFRTSDGRLIFSTFSSHIHRIQHIIDLTQKFGRRLYLNGRSMITNIKIASQLGYIRLPAGLIVESNDLGRIPSNRVVVLTTGCQGEPMSALSLMATSRHKYIQVEKGDTVVLSSRFIPGNEKAINHIINSLYRLGARVLYEGIAHVHASGHAGQQELRLMLNLIRPKYFIPIHGEYRHLVQHAELACQSGIPMDHVIVAEDGDVIHIHGGRVWKEGSVEAGRIFVDGKGVGDVGITVLRDRQHLSEDGVVVSLIVLNKGSGEILYGPEVFSRGFIFEDESSELIEAAKAIVLQTVQELRDASEAERLDPSSEIRRALKSYFNRIIRRRPMILPIIVEL